MIRKLAAAILFASGFVASDGHAQSLYETQNGLWGLDGCAASEGYFFARDTLYLNLYQQEGQWTAMLSKPVAQRATATHLIEEYKYGESYYIYYSWFEDGKLSMASSPGPSPTEQKIESLPDQPPADYALQHYEKCDRLPPDVYFVHAEGAKFMELVAALRDGCPNEQQACIDRAFAYVDVSGDGRLSTAEVARIMRILTYAAVAANPQGATNEEITGALGLMSLVGPLISSAIVSGADYDGDGQLTMAEMFYDRDVITVQGAMEQMSLEMVGSSIAAIFQGMGTLPMLLGGP
jgi:hypothetical protein